jgi:hypothetical protein
MAIKKCVDSAATMRVVVMGRSQCKCFSVNQRLADFHKKIAQPAATSFFCYPKACWKPKSDQLHAFQIKKKGNECRTFSMQRCRASGSHCIPKGFNDCRKR